MSRSGVAFLLLLSVAVAESTGCTPAGTNVSVSSDSRPARTIAVLDLEWKAPEGPPKETGVYAVSPPDAGSAVADQISSLLIGVQGYRLVERTQLRRLLSESDLRMADIVEKGEYRRVGKLVGADTVVVGQVTAYSVGGWGPFALATAAFGARAVDVDTGEVLWVINGSRKIDYCVEPGLCVAQIIEGIKPRFLSLLRENRPQACPKEGR